MGCETRRTAYKVTAGAFAIALFAARPGTASGSDSAAETTIPTLDRVCTLRWVDRSKKSSFHCLGCHDGTVASGDLYGQPISLIGTHPVDVDYSAAQLAGRGALRPPSEIPSAVVLVDGKVTCTSCHAGTSNEPSRTAMTMKRSALCFACHDY